MSKKILPLLIVLSFGIISCNKNESQELPFKEKKDIDVSIVTHNDIKPEKASPKQQCQLNNNVEYSLETSGNCFYIKENCDEGDINCANVDLVLVDKVSKKEIKTKGKPIGLNNFIGYSFNVENKVYAFYLQDTDSYKLEIWDKGETKVLSEEKLEEIERK